MKKQIYENNLKEWIKDEKAAIELISVLGKLWFDKSVELIIFRNQMVDRSSSELLNLHHYAREVVKESEKAFGIIVEQNAQRHADAFFWIVRIGFGNGQNEIIEFRFPIFRDLRITYQGHLTVNLLHGAQRFYSINRNPTAAIMLIQFIAIRFVQATEVQLFRHFERLHGLVRMKTNKE